MFKRSSKLNTRKSKIELRTDDPEPIAELTAESISVAKETNSSVQPPEPNVMIYAGFWKRSAADLLDWLFLGTTQFALFVPAMLVAVCYMSTPSYAISQFNNLILVKVGVILFAVLACFSAVLPWLYFACCESSRLQATLGKMLIGLKVTDVHGQRIGYFNSILRLLLVAICACLPIGIACAVRIFMPQPEGIIPTIVLSIIGMLTPVVFTLLMLLNQKQQTGYDMVVKRLVIVDDGINGRKILMAVCVAAFVTATTFAFAITAKHLLEDQAKQYVQQSRS